MLKVVNHIEKNDLIILDDFGLQPLTDNARLALLQILEDCYERKSVIVTSQLPVGKWYDYINEPTIAYAIMDRLTANAHREELKGESMRQKNIKKYLHSPPKNDSFRVAHFKPLQVAHLYRYNQLKHVLHLIYNYYSA